MQKNSYLQWQEDPACLVIDIVGNSRIINSNLESLPKTTIIGLSSYLSFGSSGIEEILKRKPHPNYIFQYQTEKHVFFSSKATILHCGCLLDVFEPLLIKSWSSKLGVEFINEDIIPLLSKGHLLSTLSTLSAVTIEKSEYKWLYEGSISMKKLFEQWNSQFTSAAPFENLSTIYSKYINFKDLVECSSGFPESNQEKCLEIWNLFLEEMRTKHGMFKREILIIGTSKSGKTTLANRLCQYFQLDIVNNDSATSNINGYVLDSNIMEVQDLSPLLERFKPITVIILAQTSNSNILDIVGLCESQNLRVVFCGSDLFEFKKTDSNPESMVWPQDDYLNNDCRCLLFDFVLQKLKPCFSFEIPKSYRKQELLRIQNYQDDLKQNKHEPIEELTYEIPNTQYSRQTAIMLETVLPEIINGLKSISLDNKDTVVMELGKYLLEK